MKPVWMAETDQDRVDFLLRDRLRPTVPILGRCLPILSVDMCTRTRPVAVGPHGGLEFLEEFPECFLEFFRCSWVCVLHIRCYRSVSPTCHPQTRAVRTRWPRPLSQETNEGTVYSGQHYGWLHDARVVVCVCLQRSTNPRLHHCCLHLPAVAKTE